MPSILNDSCDENTWGDPHCVLHFFEIMEIGFEGCSLSSRFLRKNAVARAPTFFCKNAGAQAPPFFRKDAGARATAFFRKNAGARAPALFRKNAGARAPAFFRKVLELELELPDSLENPNGQLSPPPQPHTIPPSNLFLATKKLKTLLWRSPSPSWAIKLLLIYTDS